jgi:hypothetical protein
MRFDFFNRILKIDWAVTFNVNVFNISLSNFAATAHVDILGNEIIFLRVNYWICMNRNQDFITFAMDTNAVIKVLELIARCELHVDVFADT